MSTHSNNITSKFVKQNPQEIKTGTNMILAGHFNLPVSAHNWSNIHESKDNEDLSNIVSNLDLYVIYVTV